MFCSALSIDPQDQLGEIGFKIKIYIRSSCHNAGFIGVDRKLRSSKTCLTTSRQWKLLPNQIARRKCETNRRGVGAIGQIKVLELHAIANGSERFIVSARIKCTRMKNIHEGIPHFIGNVGVNDWKTMKPWTGQSQSPLIRKPRSKYQFRWLTTIINQHIAEIFVGPITADSGY